jgi:hypothetical protein
MLKKAKKAVNTIPKSGKMLTGLVAMFFDLAKHWIHDVETSTSRSKTDNLKQHFSDIEHMLIRLEDKLNQNRRDIEDLKSKLYICTVIIIGLLVTVVVQLFHF